MSVTPCNFIEVILKRKILSCGEISDRTQKLCISVAENVRFGGKLYILVKLLYILCGEKMELKMSEEQK